MNRRKFLDIGGRAAVGCTASAALAMATPARAAKPDARIQVGQIGTGHAHAAGKMSTFRKLVEDYDVVGVVEPDPARRSAVQSQSAYRGLKWMTEDELLETPGLEVVAVETGVDDLVPTAARCVEADMHLHLDKPAGASLDAYRRLLAEASRRRRVVQMGYMFRHNPAFTFCFHAIREGWLGDVFELDGVISKLISSERREGLARYPGGAMFELGCHLIDALVAAMGKPDRVTPYLRRTQADRDDPADRDDLADNTLAVFEYPRATCTIRSALIEVDGPRRRQFVVCGNQGTIDIRPLEPPKLLLALLNARGDFRKGYQEVSLEPMPGRYDEQLRELARVVRGEKATDYLIEHDLAVHETILRASGMPVE